MTIPESVTEIGESAFEGTPWLNNQPDGLIYIGKVAYKYKGTMPAGTSISIKEGTVSISGECFVCLEGCSGLTSVTIPNSVTSIGSNAFSGCSGLTSVTIGNSVTSIGDYAFYKCSGLTNLIWNAKNCSSDGNMPKNGITSITIGKDVESISNGFFSEFKGLNTLAWNAKNCSSNGNMPTGGITSATIGNEVEILPNYFLGGSKITSITIPNSITSIGGWAFSGCNNIENLIWNAKNCTSNGNMPTGGIKTVIIGNEVEILPDNFVRESQIKFVIIPNSVTKIGSYAFYNCSGVTSWTIPNAVTEIGEKAFDGTLWYNNQQDGLIYINSVAYKYKGTMPAGTSISLEEGTVSISGECFKNCSGLTSIEIPNSVTTIGGGAFSKCSGLTSVTIPNSVTTIGDLVFWQCSGLASVTIGNSVTSIGDSAFRDCSGLTSVTIGNSVTSIGYMAFNWCRGLTSVTIPNSVTSIGSYAFSHCGGLTSVTIGNSVTSIGEKAFNECNGLTKVEISDLAAWCGITFENFEANPLCFAQHLYMNGSEIKDLVIPNSVIEIGNWAFYNCSGLTSVTIPNSVTYIGSDVFRNCSGLTSMIIGNSVTSIGERAFEGCSGLTNLVWNAKNCSSNGNMPTGGITSATIGNEVEILPDNFLTGSKITEITIPESVSSIGGYAFFGCVGLTSVTNNSLTPQSIDDYVFYGVDVPNCKLYVWHESFDAYKAAPVWKDFLVEAGVEGVEVDAATKEVEGYYDLKGIRLNEPARGQVNIVRYTDGTAKKVVVK